MKLAYFHYANGQMHVKSYTEKQGGECVEDMKKLLGNKNRLPVVCINKTDIRLFNMSDGLQWTGLAPAQYPETLVKFIAKQQEAEKKRKCTYKPREYLWYEPNRQIIHYARETGDRRKHLYNQIFIDRYGNSMSELGKLLI